MDKRKKQLTLARTDNLTEYEQKVFDLIQLWGSQRVRMLAMVFHIVFSDDEIGDAGKCAAKLYSLADRPPVRTFSEELRPIAATAVKTPVVNTKPDIPDPEPEVTIKAIPETEPANPFASMAFKHDPDTQDTIEYVSDNEEGE